MAANSGEQPPKRRRGRGRPFQPGQSGNPTGRPKVVAEIRDLARVHGPAMILRLVELAGGDDERVAVAAAQALLDRGYGKPAQAITGEDGGAVKIDVAGDGLLEALQRLERIASA